MKCEIFSIKLNNEEHFNRGYKMANVLGYSKIDINKNYDENIE